MQTVNHLVGVLVVNRVEVVIVSVPVICISTMNSRLFERFEDFFLFYRANIKESLYLCATNDNGTNIRKAKVPNSRPIARIGTDGDSIG